MTAESALKPGLTYELLYDKLVIGVGSLCNTFGTPGVVENAYFLRVSKKNAASGKMTNRGPVAQCP